MQNIMYGLTFLILYQIIWRKDFAVLAGLCLQAFMWFVNGLDYHLLYFSTINKAAFVFGPVFLLQAALFIRYARHMPAQMQET